jgi:hypothetical protein
MPTSTKTFRHGVERCLFFYRATSKIGATRRFGPRRLRAAAAWNDLFDGRLR